MRFTTFKNIETKVRKPSFYDSYIGLDKILYILSFFGNVASVFLASFFFTKLLSETITDITSPYFVWGVTIFLLSALELLKRNIFHKFSVEFVRYKNFFNGETFILSIFSIAIISLSFYSSLRGAREFSAKNDLIEANTNMKVDNYKDSLKLVYDGKIQLIEKLNAKYDDRISLQDNISLTSTKQSDKRRIEREINKIRVDKDKNELKIKELKKEYESDITQYEKTHVDRASNEIVKNKANSITFVMISTVIELLILIGIFFNNNFHFVSYNSMRELVISKDSYKNWLLYNELLDYMYSNNVLTVDKLVALCSLNSINIDDNSIKSFFNLLVNIGIYDGSKLIVKKKEAENKLNDYFKMI